MTKSAIAERRSRDRIADKRSDDVHAAARRHICEGGGVWVGDGPDVCNHIAEIARKHFDGKAQEAELGLALKGATVETEAIIWGVIGSHEEAAFALGAAVGMQLANKR